MGFTDILNLSIRASWLVLAIVLLRQILKLAPRAFHCALWALVAIRLLCPLSLESAMSLIPSREVIPQAYLAMEPREPEFREQARLDIVTNPVYDTGLTIALDTTADHFQSWDMTASVLWLAGMGAMGIYAAYSYLSLRLRVRMAGWSGGRVYECDGLETPFILGLIRPRIYLPSDLDQETKIHVLAHENAHLKRLDHIWKPLGFALLAIHWFNPIMWLAYALLCRDIELACDEKVIKKLDKPQVRAYSEALVRCSVSHRSVVRCPLAFGEVGVKGRIKAMLHYKRPGFWLLLAAVAAVTALAVCFLTDPPPSPEGTMAPPMKTSVEDINSILSEDGCIITKTVQREADIMFYLDWLPEGCFSPGGYPFQEGELPLLETNTTILEFARVIPEGETLRCDFRFRYTLPESGTLLLPCRVNSEGVSYDLRLTGYFHDFNRDYTDGVMLEQKTDSMEFTLFFDRELVENADDYLSVGLGNLWETTYIPEGLQIQDKELSVKETLYRDDRYTLSGTAAYASAYIVGRDLHLTALESCSRWDIRRNMGALSPMELTPENFDALFQNGYSLVGFAPSDLREENIRAWFCDEQELRHLLLQQSDGSLYLAVLRENGTILSDFYRLSIGDDAAQAPEVIRHSYDLNAPGSFDTPGFILSTDGTFTMNISILSSYYGKGRYVLDEDRLVMKTEDGRYTWVFVPDGTGFRYVAAQSSPIAYLKSPHESSEVPDGALFGSHDSRSESPLTLEEAVNQTILAHNRTKEDENLICVENHEVLGELIACGVNTVDGGTPLEILSLSLAGEYRTYDAELRSLRFEQFCAAITLESREQGYVVTEYAQSGEAESIFPDHILERYDERYRIINTRTTTQNRDDAQLLQYQALGLETDIGTLLGIICSSPAQSSNPGDYIAAHAEEFDRLVRLGSHTVDWCFTQFAEGDQTDLRGHIMALACREILGDHADESEYGICMTGQDWFDQFTAIAAKHRSQEQLLEFERTHPWCFLALEILGI